MVGHNVSGRPVEGFISPSFGEVEFLGKDEVPEPKVFQKNIRDWYLSRTRI